MSKYESYRHPPELSLETLDRSSPPLAAFCDLVARIWFHESARLSARLGGCRLRAWDSRRINLFLALKAARSKVLTAVRHEAPRATAAGILDTVIDRCYQLQQWDTGFSSLTHAVHDRFSQLLTALQQDWERLAVLQIHETERDAAYVHRLLKGELRVMANVVVAADAGPYRKVLKRCAGLTAVSAACPDGLDHENVEMLVVLTRDLCCSAQTRWYQGMGGQSAAPPTDPSAIIISLGNQQYRIGDNQPILVSDTEDYVLQAFLKRSMMSETDLVAISGVNHAARVLRRFAKKNTVFAPAIRCPGVKNSGGFQVNIKIL